MELLVPLLASLVLLLATGVLLSTLGRRRRHRPRQLPEAQRAALAGMLGEGLATLVASAVQLRQEIDALARHGREMLAVERQLGRSVRRPLWRQIEHANYGHELGELARGTETWLAMLQALPSVELQVIDELGLDLEPMRALDAALRELRSSTGAGLDALRSRDEDVRTAEQRLDAAALCLQRLERGLAAYRGGGYR